MNTDFPFDLLEFLISGDEVGFAVLREGRSKAIRTKNPRHHRLLTSAEEQWLVSLWGLDGVTALQGAASYLG